MCSGSTDTPGGSCCLESDPLVDPQDRPRSGRPPAPVRTPRCPPQKTDTGTETQGQHKHHTENVYVHIM